MNIAGNCPNYSAIFLHLREMFKSNNIDMKNNMEMKNNIDMKYDIDMKNNMEMKEIIGKVYTDSNL